jgi:hypothetical protein
VVTPGFLRLGSTDSTIHTICLSCFRTVIQSEALAVLAAAERDHVCAEFDLGLLHLTPLSENGRQESGHLIPW